MNSNTSQAPLVNAYDLGQCDAQDYFIRKMGVAANINPGPIAHWIEQQHATTPGYTSGVKRLQDDNAFAVAYKAGFDVALAALVDDLRESDTYVPPAPPPAPPPKPALSASDELLRIWAKNDAARYVMTRIAELARIPRGLMLKRDLNAEIISDLQQYRRMGGLSYDTDRAAKEAMAVIEHSRGEATPIQRSVYGQEFLDQAETLISLWKP